MAPDCLEVLKFKNFEPLFSMKTLYHVDSLHLSDTHDSGIRPHFTLRSNAPSFDAGVDL